jgi:ribosome maturation protein Sdo1
MSLRKNPRCGVKKTSIFSTLTKRATNSQSKKHSDSSVTNSMEEPQVTRSVRKSPKKKRCLIKLNKPTISLALFVDIIN